MIKEIISKAFGGKKQEHKEVISYKRQCIRDLKDRYRNQKEGR